MIAELSQVWAEGFRGDPGDRDRGQARPSGRGARGGRARASGGAPLGGVREAAAGALGGLGG